MPSHSQTTNIGRIIDLNQDGVLDYVHQGTTEVTLAQDIDDQWFPIQDPWVIEYGTGIRPGLHNLSGVHHFGLRMAKRGPK